MLTHPKDVIKFCPRCGNKGFRSDNQGRSFSCEGCHFSYYMNSAAAVACLIFNEEGQLLLARRAIEPARGMLDLPGGFVEPMESGENAVIREIEEELGVRVTKAEFMVSFPNEYVFSGFSVFTLDMAFICEVDNISGLVPADDVSDIEFIVPLEINKGELCSESMVKIIDYYINHKK